YSHVRARGEKEAEKRDNKEKGRKIGTKRRKEKGEEGKRKPQSGRKESYPSKEIKTLLKKHQLKTGNSL
ncbi:hypothetical protein, partial [Bacteroides sp. CAG:633]|uniref:hypothetical protein n=1 Tax=Bacteroides sp. CAG:633 TaxID=1262744 RepID=UPI00258F1F85